MLYTIDANPAKPTGMVRSGGYTNGKSSIEEIYWDDKLEASVFALEQLSPLSQELVTSLIRQLAERENITIPLAIIGILAVIGGIYSLQRKKFGLAVTGSIAAFLPFSLLGLASIILIALSRDEFE